MFSRAERYSITDATKVFKRSLCPEDGHKSLPAPGRPQRSQCRMSGTYDYFLVVLAILGAVAASAALALKMAGRVYRAHLESNARRYNEMLEQANARLRHAATHDALTGLPNRVLLADRLAQATAQSERHSRGFAVLVVDLDRFKSINDSLGHIAGDDLLQEVAQR